MAHMRVLILSIAALSVSFVLPQTKDLPEAAASRVKFAGARSSAYGIRPFPSAEGWTRGLKTMASYFPGSTPVGIWIVGRLHGASRGMSLEFPRPDDGTDYGPFITFADTDKHEPFLTAFDAGGIKLFLQIEPGFAEVETGIDLVLGRYKHHRRRGRVRCRRGVV
jgi:hypothetical protein